MIPTRGLTHLALPVRDLERTAAFYREVFGAVEVYRGAGFVQLQTPGSWDVLVLEAAPHEIWFERPTPVDPPRPAVHSTKLKSLTEDTGDTEEPHPFPLGPL